MRKVVILPICAVTILVAVVVASLLLSARHSPSAPQSGSVNTVPSVAQTTSGTPPAAPTSSQPASPALEPRPSVAKVFAAGGVRQFIDCRGPASVSAVSGPTLVMIPGLGDGHSTWARVLPELLKTTRVCVYDRPGIERSPPRASAITADAGVHARELHALLDAAGEGGALVLLGHSYGGPIARAFAGYNPKQVPGVVLLDSVYPAQWQVDGRYWHEPGATIDVRASGEVVSAMPTLGRKPLVVMTSGIGETALWKREQVPLAQLSQNSEHVMVSESTHAIQRDRPDAVIAAATAVLNAVRENHPLPACQSVQALWARHGSICV